MALGQIIKMPDAVQYLPNIYSTTSTQMKIATQMNRTEKMVSAT